MILVPHYYQKFKCIADQCRHSCCIGWEIEIDPQSLNRYDAVPGPLGVKLRANILKNGEEACFRLGEGERCPFLDQRELCEIYRELGEDSLCNICKDHPRFRNFFSDRTEMGLGLCCEEAARLILEQTEPFRLVSLESGHKNPTPEESAFFAYRQKILETLQNSVLPLAERLPIPDGNPDAWAAFYLKLERLEPAWAAFLEKLQNADQWLLPPGQEKPLEQLAVYFIYRHLADGLWEGNLQQRTKFAALSVWLIATLHSLTGEPLAELARLYSAEIEYSDENLQMILNFLS